MKGLNSNLLIELGTNEINNQVVRHYIFQCACVHVYTREPTVNAPLPPLPYTEDPLVERNLLRLTKYIMSNVNV